jgi:hypothetical protein
LFDADKYRGNNHSCITLFVLFLLSGEELNIAAQFVPKEGPRGLINVYTRPSYPPLGHKNMRIEMRSR